MHSLSIHIHIHIHIYCVASTPTSTRLIHILFSLLRRLSTGRVIVASLGQDMDIVRSRWRCTADVCAALSEFARPAMQSESTENVEPSMANTALDSADSMRSTPAAEPRRPKPGILRLDISKPRRSSGGSVDFRCVSGAGGGGGASSANVTGANSEVSEHDLQYARECLRFGQSTCSPCRRTGQPRYKQQQQWVKRRSKNFSLMYWCIIEVYLCSLSMYRKANLYIQINSRELIAKYRSAIEAWPS